MALGEYREAANCFRKALRIYPHLAAVRQNLALAEAQATIGAEIALARLSEVLQDLPRVQKKVDEARSHVVGACMFDRDQYTRKRSL
jgi:tetratricopeptide (TPR) repeat protein